MTTSTITFLREDAHIAEIDAIAKSINRPRSYVINEALDQYTLFNKQQIAKINHGIADADAGNFVSDKEWGDTINGAYLN